MGKLLKKEDLRRFLNKLRAGRELYLPIKEEHDILKFKLYSEEDFSRIDFTENTRFPPLKKHLMPQKERLFDIEGNVLKRKGKPPEVIVFGVKHCDLTSLTIMDKFFEGDSYYKERRDKLIVIGMNCTRPADSCFCGSMKLSPAFDLFFYDINDQHYYIEVGSDRGRRLVSGLKDALMTQEELKKFRAECTKKLDEKDFSKIYESPMWEEGSKMCLSCGMCSNLCPTCLCFDIRDEMTFDLNKGRRVRVWDYCHAKDFTKVAGGHIFRPERNSRFKHRIYHKLDYFPKEYGMYMCTGCGRCIKYCPTNIDFVEIANKIKQ